MIEIPRAALTADEIAKEADFFCFGTNDLTQMTFGFSSDDAGKFLNAYYDAKIFENDPFAKLDQTGVGKLMDMAVKLGKPVNPKLHIGICGEHGGDPSSLNQKLVLIMYHVHHSEYLSLDLLLLRLQSLTSRKVDYNYMYFTEFLITRADVNDFMTHRPEYTKANRFKDFVYKIYL